MEKITEIREAAEKLDNKVIVATGIEFYATGVERAGEWTERDLFIMEKLKLNFKLDK